MEQKSLIVTEIAREIKGLTKSMFCATCKSAWEMFRELSIQYNHMFFKEIRTFLKKEGRSYEHPVLLLAYPEEKAMEIMESIKQDLNK